MKKIFALLLMLVLVLFTSCGTKPPVYNRNETENSSMATGELSKTAETHVYTYHDALGNTTDKVKRLFPSYMNMVLYDDCLYFEYGGTIKKFNVKTGLCSYACADPGCSHNNKNCPLYCIDISKIDHISDDTIYWATRGVPHKMETQFYAYNMKTFEKTMIFSLPTVGGTGIRHVDYGEYMYFKYPVLKEWGDPEKSSDYQMNIVEVNKKTGEQKAIFGLTNNSDSLMIALDDGRLLLYESYLGFYTINRDGTNKNQFLPGDQFDSNISSSAYVVGNKLYYAKQVGEDESVYPGGAQRVELTRSDGSVFGQTLPLTSGCAYYNIFCADIDTGEITTVVEDKANMAYWITDSALYYFTYDYHMLEGEHIYGPTENWGNFKAPRASGSSGEMWKLDLETGEKELVRNNFGFEYLGDAIIVGDYCFSRLDGVYDYETNSFNYDDYYKYVRYDLTNNTYEVIDALN